MNGGTINQLIEDLKSSHVHLRQHASRTLAELKDERAIPGILEAMKTGDASVKCECLFALKSIGHPKTYFEITRMVVDVDANVRRAALAAAVSVNPNSGTMFLIDSLNDDHAQVRRTSVQMLGELKIVSAIDKLTDLLYDEDAGVRLAAARAMVELDPRSNESLSAIALEHPDVEIRFSIACALAELGDPASIPVLIQAITEGSHLQYPAGKWLLTLIQKCDNPDELEKVKKTLFDSAVASGFSAVCSNNSETPLAQLIGFAELRRHSILHLCNGNWDKTFKPPKKNSSPAPARERLKRYRM
jgi:hypothetical protein